MEAPDNEIVYHRVKEPEKPPPQRKRFQFSILDLLLFIGFVGSAIALYLNWSPWQRCLIGYDFGSGTELVGYCDNESKVVLQSGNRIRIVEVGPIGTTIAEIHGYTLFPSRYAPFPGRIEGRIQGEESLFAWGDDGTVASFDCRTGNMIRKYEGLCGPIVSRDISPDNKRVLAVSSRGIVQVWDVASAASLARADVADEPISNSMFCAGSDRFFTMTKSGQYLIRNAETGAQVVDINSIAYGNKISKPSIFAERGRTVWYSYDSKGNRESLILADTTTGQEVRRWKIIGESDACSFQYSPHGKWLWVTGLGEGGQFIDTTTGNLAQEFPAYASSVSFSEDEKWCLVNHSLIDMNSFVAREAFDGLDVCSASMSEDGELIAVGIHNCAMEWAGGARIFDSKSLRMVSKIVSFAHVTHVALSPTGKCLLTYDHENGAYFYRRIRDEDVGLLTLPEFWLTIFFGSIVFWKSIRRIAGWWAIRKNRKQNYAKDASLPA